jgi:hypothetical protein
MVEYFRLDGPLDSLLQASNKSEAPSEESVCPISGGGAPHRLLRRVSTLELEVKHAHRDHWLISSEFEGLVIHERLAEEFDRRGFTGSRLRPATVRFQDGYLSEDYSELVVTGWAGVAPPESGIELKEACDGCGLKQYSPLKDPRKLIDWKQWTGEDFFIVWPLPKHIMITRRVADALEELKVKSYRLENMVTGAGDVSGYTVGSLSGFLPKELAVRYGTPLGLERA